MTAFAYHSNAIEWGHLTWEIRSVNHRFLDISLRLPEELRPQEYHLRKVIQKCLRRGKIEAILRCVPSKQSNATIQINENLAQSLIQACHQINDHITNPSPIVVTDILMWPGVIEEPKKAFHSLTEQTQAMLETALEDLIATREREGNRLSEFLYQRCDQIAEIVLSVRKRYSTIVDAIREKMRARLDEILLRTDNERLDQEIALIAQRLDIDEELDRLMAHLDEVNAVLERNEPVGRRLDFLMQELNREANTLASKAADAETTRAAVDLKVLIEQMREQVQNIE